MRPSVLTCIHKAINRVQAREGLVFCFDISCFETCTIISRLVPLSKRSSSIFSRKISFYPMPDAVFPKISGAKLEILTLKLAAAQAPSLLYRDSTIKELDAKRQSQISDSAF